MIFLADFEDFQKSLLSPVRFSKKWPGGGGTKKCPRFMTSRTRIQNLYVIYKISFVFDSGRSFDSISLELGKTIISIENCSCIVFGSIWPNEGGARGYANSRIFRK